MTIKYNELPHIQKIRAAFDYDFDKGRLMWASMSAEDFNTERGFKIAKSKKLGKQASVQAGEYRRVAAFKTFFPEHRLIWAWHYGPIPSGLMVDHIDGNGLNNRIENLRLVDHSQNLANQKLAKNSTSGFGGVSFDRRDKRWIASCMVRRKTYRIGRFSSQDDAIEAVSAFRKIHGFTDRHAS